MHFNVSVCQWYRFCLFLRFRYLILELFRQCLQFMYVTDELFVLWFRNSIDYICLRLGRRPNGAVLYYIDGRYRLRLTQMCILWLWLYVSRIRVFCLPEDLCSTFTVLREKLFVLLLLDMYHYPLLLLKFCQTKNVFVNRKLPHLQANISKYIKIQCYEFQLFYKP